RFRMAPTPTPNPPSVVVKTAPPELKPTQIQQPPASSEFQAQTPLKTRVSRKAERPKFVPVKGTERAEGDQVSRVKLLPGERSYLKTIAALDSSLKSKNARPMRPSLQSEYERNLAMVDRAIAATRNAAKKNPNDPDAAEFMFAAYQTKVDL